MNQGCREFDVRHTPSCVGVITDIFRTLPGVERSLHPTHSVAARGKLARELIEGHHHGDTPCGTGTPYARLLDKDGQILFLGVGLECNTAFHTVEAIADLAYLMNDEEERFTVIDASGSRSSIDVRRHRNGVSRGFDRMTPHLLQCGALRTGEVGSAKSLLIDGLAFKDYMLTLLARDPDALVTSDSSSRRQ